MRPILFAAVPLALAACAPAADLPPLAPLAAAAEPTAASAAVEAPLFESYARRAVVEPADWRTLNDRQAPGARQ